MRIGVFERVHRKALIILCQRVPEDCPEDENNYEGDDPSEAIQVMKDAGYKVLVLWASELDDVGKVKKKIDQFHKETKIFGVH